MKKILILCMLLMVNPIASKAIIVIYNNEKVELDTLTLRDIFTRKTVKWPNTAQTITVFIKPPRSIEHKIFTIEKLGITSYRYNKLLNRQIYSGQVTHPVVLQSDTEMITRVSHTPNSIGYIDNHKILINIDNVYSVEDK